MSVKLFLLLFGSLSVLLLATSPTVWQQVWPAPALTATASTLPPTASPTATVTPDPLAAFPTATPFRLSENRNAAEWGRWEAGEPRGEEELGEAGEGGLEERSLLLLGQIGLADPVLLPDSTDRMTEDTAALAAVTLPPIPTPVSAPPTRLQIPALELDVPVEGVGLVPSMDITMFTARSSAICGP